MEHRALVPWRSPRCAACDEAPHATVLGVACLVPRNGESLDQSGRLFGAAHDGPTQVQRLLPSRLLTAVGPRPLWSTLRQLSAMRGWCRSESHIVRRGANR